MFIAIIDWLQKHQLPCLYKKILGFDCPGCGMQSAVIELLKGNICESIKLYPALIPIIFMFIFLLLHIIFKIKNGANILKFLFIANTIIILINYLFKIFIK